MEEKRAPTKQPSGRVHFALSSWERGQEERVAGLSTANSGQTSRAHQLVERGHVAVEKRSQTLLNVSDLLTEQREDLVRALGRGIVRFVRHRAQRRQLLFQPGGSGLRLVGVGIDQFALQRGQFLLQWLCRLDDALLLSFVRRL